VHGKVATVVTKFNWEGILIKITVFRRSCLIYDVL